MMWILYSGSKKKAFLEHESYPVALLIKKMTYTDNIYYTYSRVKQGDTYILVELKGTLSSNVNMLH